MSMTIQEQTSAEEAALMAALAEQQESALEKVQSRYRRMLKSVVMQIVRNDAEADDVLQEVFVQIWKRAKRYSANKGKLTGWLSTVARRRAIDYVRHNSAYRRATDRYEDYCREQGPDVASIDATDTVVDRHELSEMLEGYLEKLPDEQEKVVRMAYYDQRSQREISRLTDTPLGTVKTRLELGIHKLAKHAKQAHRQFRPA